MPASRRLPFLVITLACLAFSARAGAAASPEITRVRGSIDTATSSLLAVKTRDGSILTIHLTPPVAVGTVRKASLADIKPGDFVGSAAVKGKDGKLHALEVHIFPESMRGTGEGQRPWDAGPNSSMTNATVGEVKTVPQGRTLTLTYKDGSATIEVAPDVPIVTLAPGNAKMLVKGRAVILFAAKQADGSLAASRVTVESNGVKPPM
jgi:hypothetical protein